MKNLLAMAVLMIMAMGNTQAQDRRILELAEKNLQQTLQNGSDMLKESAMEVVMDLRKEFGVDQSRTIVPLMAILRNHSDSGMRMLAAFTLKELADERGLYAIREASRFDNNKTVRHLCASLDTAL